MQCRVIAMLSPCSVVEGEEENGLLVTAGRRRWESTRVEDYQEHDGLGLAGLVARREVSPDELLDAALARLDRVEPRINALTQRLADHGRAAIARGLPAGPFTGVPFLLKDVSALLEGTATTGGSRLFDGSPADHDSTIVARYKDAGLVIFGKTNTPEFGLAASTESSHFGPTRNPWDLTRTAGGSSGGAAAAVASGIVPMAHGSDGGGSRGLPARHPDGASARQANGGVSPPLRRDSLANAGPAAGTARPPAHGQP